MSLERTPRQIAELLGVDPKAVRHWLRLQGWRSPEEAGTEWRLTAEQALLVHEEFLGRISSATSDLTRATFRGRGDLSGVCAGQRVVGFGIDTLQGG